MRDADAACVGILGYVLDARDGAGTQEIEHRFPRIGRTKRELERQRRGQRAGLGATPETPRSHPVARAEQCVEAAHAGKTAGKRNLGNGQRRVGQQALGKQEPLRLCILYRRNTVLAQEDAAQMPACHADPAGEMLDTSLVEHAVLDQAHSAAGELLRRIHARMSGGKLRTAAQAGTVSRNLGSRGARKEMAVLAARHAHRANGTAIDPRRRNADEKAAVESGIVRRKRAVTDVGIEWHGRIMDLPSSAGSPFSDI